MMIDFNKFVQAFESASLFELYRLRSTISKMLEDPKKISTIRRQLRPGMQISYFEDNENRLVEATVINVRRTMVLVQRHDNNSRWNIYLECINLENISVDLAIKSNKTGELNRTNLKIGDRVGWISSKENQEMFGTIVKLNLKRAQIELSDKQVWNVPYSMLFPVIDAENASSAGRLFEGEILEDVE